MIKYSKRLFRSPLSSQFFLQISPNNIRNKHKISTNNKKGKYFKCNHYPFSRNTSSNKNNVKISAVRKLNILQKTDRNNNARTVPFSIFCLTANLYNTIKGQWVLRIKYIFNVFINKKNVSRCISHIAG